MWPNESSEYRAARNRLVDAEAELRAKAEAVAAARRALPEGGAPKEDYVFDDAGTGEPIRLSQLFAQGQRTLLLYSFMYAPGGNPCPMCTSLLDSLDAAAPQITQRVSLAVAAKAEPGKLRAFAESRRWRNLRLISSHGNNYNADYRAENNDGAQMPIMHVWAKRDGKIRHFWASELFYRSDSGWTAHPRHADTIWPLWNVFDLTPEGRGSDWYPSIA